MEKIIFHLNQQIQGLKAFIISQGVKKALTLEEVSAYTGLSKSYLYKLTSANKIPHYKPNNKLVYFNREEIDEWLLQNRIKTKAEIEVEAATYTTLNNR